MEKVVTNKDMRKGGGNKQSSQSLYPEVNDIVLLNPISHGGGWIPPPPLKEKFKYSLMVNAKVPKVLDFS